MRTVRFIATVLALGVGTPGEAQQAVDTLAPAPPAPPPTGGWVGYAVDEQSWGTVVAITAVVPAGSASDPPGLEGTAWLFGEMMRDGLEAELGADMAGIGVDVTRNRTVVRMVVVPEAWPRAYAALEDLLFAEGSDLAGPDDRQAWLAAARSEMSAVFAFESGAPVRDFERELSRMLSSLSDPWSRNPRGTSESIAAIRVTDLLDHRSRHFRRERAALAITGAVEGAEVARRVTREPSQGGSVTASHVAVAGEPAIAAGAAWSTGERIVQIRDVTSGWIAVAYPFDSSVSWTAMELFQHKVRGELITDPPAPGLFSADLELVEGPRGHPILLVQAAVLPDDVEAWERRITSAVQRVVDERIPLAFFNAERRRYRTARLLADAEPEERGLRLTLDLLREGEVRSLTEEIWDLEPGQLEAAIEALGPPRILVFGPDLSAGEGASGNLDGLAGG